MSPTTLLTLLFLLTVSAAEFATLSSSTVTKIQRKIRPVVKGKAIPTALRLAFHDCVGGCDGCLNVDNPSNAGLADLVADLDAVYLENGYDTVLSRADLWALAGIYAVDKGIEFANDACSAEECAVPASGLVFQWGRQDCSTAPYTEDDKGLPAATLDHGGVMEFFQGEFGFDANETVALLGAHTLGRASSANSGFNGAWISGQTSQFNNEYYKKLSDASLTWQHRDSGSDASTPHWQWTAQGVAFMINADVALYKDIQVDADGQSSCDFDTCEPADTAEVVEAFAASNDAWVSEFTKVFTKMLAHKASSLQDLS